MKQLFQLIRDRLSADEALVLVTVTATTGAAPRGAGARMLVGQEGRLYGTIGGGAVEYRSEQIAQTVLQEQTSLDKDFSLTRNDVENLGMICGGAVQVFFHYIPAGDPQTMAVAVDALQRMDAGTDLWLISDLTAGGALSLTERCGSPMDRHLTRQPHQLEENGHTLYVEQIQSAGRVYVFGGGHVAQELVPVLSHVGFRCVVMDDRKEFADPALFPTAEAVILGDFQTIDRYLTIGAQDYVCVMTRGHASDTIIQAQVLPCHPCYCGVIGSASKAAGVRKALKEEYRLTDDLLDQVTTPIGLKIKAQTPAEIAVSIAAQMILHRAERMEQNQR